jgi:hypothetical protein
VVPSSGLEKAQPFFLVNHLLHDYTCAHTTPSATEIKVFTSDEPRCLRFEEVIHKRRIA